MKDKLKTKEAIITLQSQEEFDRLLEFLESRDIHWGSSAKPTAHKDYYPIWGVFLHNDWIICAHQSEELQGNYKYPHFTVDEFIREESNVMRDTFTKDDLENGMIVKTRCDYVYLYLDCAKNKSFVRDAGRMSLIQYDNDLTVSGQHESIFDIMEVYKCSSVIPHLDLARLIMWGGAQLIWKRDEKPVEMTIAEIEEKLGIKNLKVVKENDND